MTRASVEGTMRKGQVGSTKEEGSGQRWETGKGGDTEAEYRWGRKGMGRCLELILLSGLSRPLQEGVLCLHEWYKPCLKALLVL